LLCTDGLWSQVQDAELEKVFAGRGVNQVLPALINVAERRAGAGGDNLSAIAVTVLDDSVELGERDDALDTEKNPPQKGGRLILESNLATMHQEILASQV
ncbi:serine/threonine-protein phosphatase, partial [Chromobacterium piscinae]